MSDPAPSLSIVVCVYNMEREFPRTLYTLGRQYQRGIADLSCEIVIVDNGSARPLPSSLWADLGCPVQYLRFPPGDPSPVRALNAGLRAARGRLVGLMVDGARMLSPGLFHHALLAERLHSRPVICTHGFHLGPDLQPKAALKGYNQQVEDALLAGINWQCDGYRLFEISVFAGSSYRGWFASPNESNCLILPRAMWEELGYLDERFATPGGGLVNLDTFCRACELPGAQLITLLGEGNFHQFHGGAATGRPATLANPNEAFDHEYEQIRGKVFQQAAYPSLLIGHIHPSAKKHLAIMP